MLESVEATNLMNQLILCVRLLQVVMSTQVVETLDWHIMLT